MHFVPAGEIIGDAHQVRTVKIAQSPQVPDGEYTFLDMYCADPECDCRKTMIQVIYNGKMVSLINFGWESDNYYKEWMGDDEGCSMSGASIDISSPDLIPGGAILALFNALLNDVWLAKIKRCYKGVKAAASE